MDVIYCAGGGKVLAEIALAEGFLYGARSDDIRPEPRCNGLIDINWKEYDWVEHVKAVKQHKPKYAVVPDITRIVDYNLAIEYAEEMEDYCGYVIIVPKIPGIIKNIPQKYVIGVSIPTS